MNIFTNFENNTSKIWNTINQLKINYKRTYLNYINYNNKILTTPEDISGAFNKYFVNIAPQLDNNIPLSNTESVSFLPGNYPISMAIPPVNLQDVKNIIKKQKVQ